MFLGTILMAAAAGAAESERPPIPVDREVTDHAVLRLVDTERPGLASYGDALAANDFDRARRLLVEHFATRKTPVLPPSSFPGLGRGNSTLVLKAGKADRTTADEHWMKHVFSLRNNDAGTIETFDLGPEIHWLENPSKALSWNLYLNQLNVVSQLAGVYQATGEEAYAAEAADMVLSWTRQVHSSFGYVRDGVPVDSGMEVRNRLCNCIAAYEVLRVSPSLTPVHHMAFWKMVITASRELMRYDGVSYPGLVAAGVMFPEFREAELWRRSGFADMRKQLVGRTTPEGAWDTHSIAYQTVPVPWAMRCLEILEANPASGIDAGQARMIRTQVTKLLEIMLRLAMPNLGLPNIGDTYGRTDWSDGTIRRILSWYRYVQKLPAAAPDTDLFSLLKTTLAQADGLPGTEPARTDQTFPGTGYTVMRSGWEPESALYLYADLSPQTIGHAHNDAGHFELYGYGKPLLVDTGDYFLGWGYRAALHNTIEVDGNDQARGSHAVMLPQAWTATSAYDLFDGEHTAYAGLGVIHRRRILFIKPDYFLLCDLLRGTGEHTYEQFFHFAGPRQTQGAAAEIDSTTLAAESRHPDCANVRITPLYPRGLEAGFVEARDTDMDIADKFTRKAMLGWIVTTGTFQRVKSAVAVYTRHGSEPQSFHDILFPIPRRGQAQLHPEILPVAAADGSPVGPAKAVAFTLRCRLSEPAREASSVQPDTGPNLAAGGRATATINHTSFRDADSHLLTDGDLGRQSLGAAMSSGPYAPGVDLQGFVTVEWPVERDINAVVLHHGIWNGNCLLYPPADFSVEYWQNNAWHPVEHADTNWSEDFVSTTLFTPVGTRRVRIRIHRPDGGRLALRECQVFRIADAELERVRALRAERRTREWSDTVLLSHTEPKPRTWGPCEFDGELALVRRDQTGAITRIAIQHGRRLVIDGTTWVEAAEDLDECIAEWDDDGLHVATTTPAGLRIAAGTAERASLRGHPATIVRREKGVFLFDLPGEHSPLRILESHIELHPPQKDLHGGQPWALVRWKTNRPATSQVNFGRDDKLSRHTPLEHGFTTEHEVRVEFLHPEKAYRFQCVSIDRAGRHARRLCVPADP